MGVGNRLVDGHSEYTILCFEFPIVVQDAVSSDGGKVQQSHDEIVHELFG